MEKHEETSTIRASTYHWPKAVRIKHTHTHTRAIKRLFKKITIPVSYSWIHRYVTWLTAVLFSGCNTLKHHMCHHNKQLSSRTIPWFPPSTGMKTSSSLRQQVLFHFGFLSSLVFVTPVFHFLCRPRCCPPESPLIFQSLRPKLPAELLIQYVIWIHPYLPGGLTHRAHTTRTDGDSLNLSPARPSKWARSLRRTRPVDWRRAVNSCTAAQRRADDRSNRPQSQQRCVRFPLGWLVNL